MDFNAYEVTKDSIALKKWIIPTSHLGWWDEEVPFEIAPNHTEVPMGKGLVTGSSRMDPSLLTCRGFLKKWRPIFERIVAILMGPSVAHG
eukprot:jgi/Botrbrau1/14168/Bobra.182_3s0106.1